MTAKSPYKNGGMFENASYLLFQKAKELRKTMTDAEIILWMNIKNGVNGFKFRRQHPIGNYIADFFCHKAKLIIELEGSIHHLAHIQALDDIKQRDLENLGYYIIRFTNNDVKLSIDNVIETIKKTIIKIINSQNQNASSPEGV